MGNAPNETIYIKNLNDKIKQDRLRETLYSMFSKHGKVLDLISSKARKLRGQAWVVFESSTNATNAMRSMQGNVIFDKEMVIDYALSKSDIIAQRDGTFKAREKRKVEEKKTTQVKKHKSRKNEMLPLIANEGNNILFVDKLPEDCTEDMLKMLFQQYPGFKEIRSVPGKKSIAFVEFVDQHQAGVALQALYGFKLSNNHFLHVNFAKK